MTARRIAQASSALLSHKGAEYATGFLSSQLAVALTFMPKTKQKAFMAQLERTVGDNVTVHVKNLMNPQGKGVDLRWDEVGGPCDPSTERYHCM